MLRSRYNLRNKPEDRKQLYWGAFMLGCAAFHQHRRDGYRLDAIAVDELALWGFRTAMIELSEPDLPYVDDENLGLAWFSDGYRAGYRARASSTELSGLEL